MNAPEHRLNMKAPEVGDLPVRITAVGSRVTCTPPPSTTDQDWLVLVDASKFDEFANTLLDDGWDVGGSMIPNDDNYLPDSQRFNSFTKTIDGTPENLIVTASPEFHRRFLAASAIAKRLNLLNKTDRIALFQAVLYAAHTDIAFGDGSTDPFALIDDAEPAF